MVRIIGVHVIEQVGQDEMSPLGQRLIRKHSGANLEHLFGARQAKQIHQEPEIFGIPAPGGEGLHGEQMLRRRDAHAQPGIVITQRRVRVAAGCDIPRGRRTASMSRVLRRASKADAMAAPPMT